MHAPLAQQGHVPLHLPSQGSHGIEVLHAHAVKVREMDRQVRGVAEPGQLGIDAEERDPCPLTDLVKGVNIAVEPRAQRRQFVQRFRRDRRR